jgi:hypothetical protein
MKIKSNEWTPEIGQLVRFECDDLWWIGLVNNILPTPQRVSFFAINSNDEWYTMKMLEWAYQDNSAGTVEILNDVKEKSNEQ